MLLIDFLNQVLPEKHRIEDLSYSRNEQLGQKDLDRKAIFDLYCVGKTGERFIVEVQKIKQNYFKDRSLFYASFPIQEQAKKGDWDFKLEPVYIVGILDFTFEDHQSKEECVHIVELRNQKCGVFYDKLKFIYIELPKFDKSVEDLDNQFEKWLYVFRHLSKLQDRPVSLQSKIFERLFEAAEIAKFSPEERIAYENSLKYYRDIQNVVDTSKQEGRTEALELVAKKLKEENVAVEQIIRVTGLTKEQIDKL